MGLLDQVLGNVLGSSGGSPMQGALMSLLGGAGQQGRIGQQQGTLGTNPSGATGSGLGGLVSMFEGAGLGHIIQSWVGGGQNQPVSPEQLHSAFGDDRVQSMSRQAGMAPTDFLSQLSQHLPRVVDGMTPNGRLPDEGTVSV